MQVKQNKTPKMSYEQPFDVIIKSKTGEQPVREKFMPTPPRENEQLGVMEGEPWVVAPDGEVTFYVPEKPHIFRAALDLKGPGPNLAAPGEPLMLVAHGKQDEQGSWIFRDGRQVKDVVGAYNSTHEAEPIRYLFVCNKDGKVVDPDIADVWHAVGAEVNVGLTHENDRTTVTASTKEDPSHSKFHAPRDMANKLLADMGSRS
jgi:hypothetical protein